MKKRYSKFANWTFGIMLTAVALIIPEIVIASYISQNDSEKFKDYLSIMLVVTLLVAVIIFVIKCLQFNKGIEEEKQKKLEVAKEQLTSEFREVVLNDSGDIPKEKFKCQAKIDENGKIICTIHVDFVTEFDSYEKFFKHFYFGEEE